MSVLLATAIIRPNPAADKPGSLGTIYSPTGPHKAKTMTPKNTVMLLQIAVMLDPEQSQQSLCAVKEKRSGRNCQGHQGRNKTYRNSNCTEQLVSSALVYQRNTVPRDSATWRTAFFADTNVTLSCCSGEEWCVRVKPGKNSTEAKHHVQTIMAYKFSRIPASCFMTLWKEKRQQVSR